MSEIILYRDNEGNVKVSVIFRDETFWMRQKTIAELFDVDVSTISRHLKNIFSEGELQEEVVVANFAITTQHGAMPDRTQNIPTKFYNLDAIIAVGYRVNSKKATQFRIWATKTLKE